MKSFNLILSILMLIFSATARAAMTESQVTQLEERLANLISKALVTTPTPDVPLTTFCENDEKDCMELLPIAIQTLDEHSHSKDETTLRAVQKFAKKYFLLNQDSPRLGEALQLYAIYRQAGGELDLAWEGELKLQIMKREWNSQLDAKSILTIIGYPEVFQSWTFSDAHLWTEKKYTKQFPALASINRPDDIDNTAAARDLLTIEPAIEKYYSGRYKNVPRLFMFCRQSREFPCLMIMKNADGAWHTSPKTNQLWSQPSLGYSRYKKSFNQSNGNTPSGVFRIDGVMPENDKQMVFGKFRRMILNFVAKTENEQNYKFLLPPSSHTLTWWQEAVVAREMGRGLFRIHGTGLSSNDQRNYYPFVPTSGCVAKRENTYDRVTFKDQREILDEIMLAMQLDPTHGNEEKIRGLLYVINLNNEKKPVTLDDVKKLGVFN
jgi:hypothetical protein